jgi:hypothetical protein
MSRRTPTHRRAVLHGACAATLTMMTAPAAGPAKAAELDGELIALLDEARSAFTAWTTRPENPTPTLEEVLERGPWEDMAKQAAIIPARTPEGMRAKAEAIRFFVLESSGNWERFHTPDQRLALSLAADLLGRSGA